jgi:hypothetical protein
VTALAWETGSGVVFLAGLWVWSLYAWPWRHTGKFRIGARTVDRVVRRAGRGKHR